MNMDTDGPYVDFEPPTYSPLPLHRYYPRKMPLDCCCGVGHLPLISEDIHTYYRHSPDTSTPTALRSL